METCSRGNELPVRGKWSSRTIVLQSEPVHDIYIYHLIPLVCNVYILSYLTQRRVNTFYETTSASPKWQARTLLNSKFALPVSCEEK